MSCLDSVHCGLLMFRLTVGGLKKTCDRDVKKTLQINGTIKARDLRYCRFEGKKDGVVEG